MTWDPAQYLRYAGERIRPAIDLLARVPLDDPRVVYDLGAGAGNVTRLLHERWPKARIVGVDASAEMLERARAEVPGVEWVRADLASWRPDAPADVVFSNAALHWLGDHEHLFPRLMRVVAPGGVLAVQMPRNFASPSHTLIDEAATRGPWRATLEPHLGWSPVAEPAFYFDLLAPLSASIDLWETTYVHVLEGDDPVKEFTKGSVLRPLLDALAEPQRTAFEAEYARLVRDAYRKRADGRTLFPFQRLFIVARAA